MNGLFKVAQVNTRHSKVVWASLGQAAQEEHLDVVLIQGPPPQLVMENNIWPGFRIAFATPLPAHSVIMYRTTLGCTNCDFLGSGMRYSDAILRLTIGVYFSVHPPH